MGLKRKGKSAKDISGRKAAVPKAGPKKRRARTEEEAIRAAVEEHGKRGVRPARRAGKVRTYTYKEPPAKVPEPEPMWTPYLREPIELERYRRELPTDLQPMAAKLFKMECDHPEKEVVSVIAPLDPSERRSQWRCNRCHCLGNTAGKMRMLYEEWLTYCPEGYDMWEWADMFTKDKSLWRFIYEEAEHMLVADVLGSEEAA